MQNANIPFSSKFPLLLPKKHPFTNSLIEYLHLKYFHAGPQKTLAFIRQRFWIINAREVIQRQLRKCLKCFRVNPTMQGQIMGNLPFAESNQHDLS